MRKEKRTAAKVPDGEICRQITKRGVGRPSAYKPEYATVAYEFCLLGAKDTEIAEELGVSEVTFNAWKHKHPAFLKSLKDGKARADSKVASKLYQRAIGAEYTEQAAFKVKNQTAPGVFTEEVEIVDLKKTAPPDTGAIAIWLKNRQGKNWKDKPELSVQVDITVQNAQSEVKALSADQLRAMRDIIKGDFTDAEYVEVE